MHREDELSIKQKQEIIAESFHNIFDDALVIDKASEENLDAEDFNTDGISYRDGFRGFAAWADDNAHISIYPEGSDRVEWVRMGELPKIPNPETGKSYRYMWLKQRQVLKEALRMENERFIYRLLIFCWQRGEGKSLLACLIQLWKFFCWPRQMIVLGANSKEQTKFVHYDIMTGIIRNSPRLYKLVGRENILDRGMIRRRNDRGHLESSIQTVSTFTGIYSNITGYTFSEMCKMQKTDFFTEIDGSTRNIPNSLGIIDSTVSPKTHILYALYEAFRDRKDKTLFFSHRQSEKGDLEDYWNPNMTDTQLESYKVRFPMGDFERFFLNTWGAGIENVFGEEMIRGMQYVGYDKCYGEHKKVIETLEEVIKMEETALNLKAKGVRLYDGFLDKKEKLMSLLMPIDPLYSLGQEGLGFPFSRMAKLEELNILSDIYDTDWAISVGLDRADPMKVGRGARTIMTIVAKGLRGSRSKDPGMAASGTSHPYIYFLLYLVDIKDSTLESMKTEVMAANKEYDTVDIITAEKWGMWDLSPWCEDQGLTFEIVNPSYSMQKAGFTELFILVRDGRFKTPQVFVPGSKEDDILREEMRVFDHDMEHKGFGSPHKSEKNGIQDDAMFSLAWNIYGSRMLDVSFFRPRGDASTMGFLYTNTELLGNY